MESTLLLKKTQAIGLLEFICQELELKDDQFKSAKKAYEDIGAWLETSPHPLLASAQIYPQGSIALKTTVCPILAAEYDVDLVCHLLLGTPTLTPAQVKALLRGRLEEHDEYKTRLKEKTRCWRIVYPGAFHLDITPAIPNARANNGAELVPEKNGTQIGSWKDSNPRGYRALFERRAALEPRFVQERAVFKRTQAAVEPFPLPARFKGILRRSVQICKRHRDNYFAHDPSLAPISIVITTLLADAYEHCVEHYEYESELDVLLDIVKLMPDYIQRREDGEYLVPNPTTNGENFAEKWNDDPRLPEAFASWHSALGASLAGITDVTGLDEITRALGQYFGRDVAAKALAAMTEQVTRARTVGVLGVSAGGRLLEGQGGTPIRKNTFFGS